jgi:Protein of unknown function (DUF3313)
MREVKANPFIAAVCSTLCALLASCASTSGTAATLEEAMSHDGLEKVSVKGIDLAYARPNAKLSHYKRFVIDPVDVAFSKSWTPPKTGSMMLPSSGDRERIRAGVASIVREEFVRELQAAGGYPVVDAAGPDVLRVKAGIANLHVAAPDNESVGRSRTYVVSAGEMTLVAELVDSESGEVQARLVDRSEARSSGPRVSLSSPMENREEARAIAAAWAKVLRNAVDRAHGMEKK